MRYLPHTTQEIEEMLHSIGVRNVDDLFTSIPASSRLNRPLELPQPLSELELRNALRALSRQNAHGEDWAIFLGGGCYSHYIPSAVNALISRGEFLTAYTPYQAEVAQGTLQAIFEYQTMVCEILGMDVANASHYDGSTAAAEGALMARTITGRKKILIARNIHPEYRAVLKTYLHDEPFSVEEIPFTAEGFIDRAALDAMLNEDIACVVAGFPNFFGLAEDLSDIAEKVHQKGGLLVTSTTEPLSLGLFKPPGEMGADIAVAEGQTFGNPISFGGPFVGFFATKQKYVRAMPGRLAGETVDADGKRGFVLTLATREQHIRREKAGSNICTNVALCALAATITMSLWGKSGYQELAQINYDRSQNLKKRLQAIAGVSIPFSGTHFNEFVVTTEKPAEDLIQALLKEKVIAGIPLSRWYPDMKNSFLLCVTEMNTEDQIQRLIQALKGAL